MQKSVLLFAALAVGVVASARAQAPCTTPKHTAFDFWQGSWSVEKRAGGEAAGTSRVEKILNGCVLYESWQGADGSRGHSFNFVDGDVWRQVWVDGSGGSLDLRGGLDGRSMVLRGERKGRSGKMVLHEIRWTPRRNGAVRQHWRASTDGGKTWNDLFDGVYTRAE